MPMVPEKPESEMRADDERDPTDSAADEILVDGREVGPPHSDRDPEDEEFDTPEKDAEGREDIDGGRNRSSRQRSGERTRHDRHTGRRQRVRARPAIGR